MLKKDLAKRKRRARRNRYAVAQGVKASRGERLRLSVFRSSRHIYGQLIDDVNHCTYVSASSLEKDMRSFEGSAKDLAKKVGEILGERALKKGYKKMVADRGMYTYHGRIASFFDGVRSAGVEV